MTIGPTRDTIGVLYEHATCEIYLGTVDAAAVLAHGRTPPAPPPAPAPSLPPVITRGSDRIVATLAHPAQLGNTTSGPPCFLRPTLLPRGPGHVALQMSTSLQAPETAIWLESALHQPAALTKPRSWAKAVPVAAGSPTIGLSLMPRDTVALLQNGLSVISNGSIHGPKLWVSADPFSQPLANWTRSDLGRHHDQLAAGQWWAGKWQFQSSGTNTPTLGMCSGHGTGGHTSNHTDNPHRTSRNVLRDCLRPQCTHPPASSA